MNFNDKLTTSYIEIIKADSRLNFLKNVYANKKYITKRQIIDLLQISLIDQWLAQFNYFRSYHLSQTTGKSDFDPQFKQHEEEQCKHRHDIADRIRQLGGRISIQPITELIVQNSNGTNWEEEITSNSFKILKNRLEEQKKAVQFYSFFLSVINRMNPNEKDTTTYDLIKHIKGDQEQHVKDLNDLAIQNGISKNIGSIS